MCNWEMFQKMDLITKREASDKARYSIAPVISLFLSFSFKNKAY